MVNAKDVHPKRYKSVLVIYDGGDDDLSIAELEEHDGTRYYGIRWNGNKTDNKGYPLQGSNPLWFDLPIYINLEHLEPIINELKKHCN